jgi:sugar/nucleoside kinase (ribokinase family)
VIISLGDIAIDIFVKPQGPAVAGSDMAGSVLLAPGGSAANVAVWAARLGAQSSFIGGAGDDFAGAFLRADLEREGVIAHLVRVPGATAAVAVLVDSATGERAMIPDRGAALQLSAAAIVPEMMPPGSLLHLPAYSLFQEPLAGAAMAAVALCKAGGGSISVDTSSFVPLRAFGQERFLDLLAGVQPAILFANDAEAALLSGEADPEAGTLMLQAYAPVVVWKLGAQGAVARAGALVQVPGLDVTVVDTTGAGDAFAAAFCVAYTAGASIAESLARANRVAAAVVGQIGARPRLDLQRC